MKQRIEVLLSAWGKWAMAGYSKGLGFSTVSPMFRDAKPGRSYESSLPSGLGCYEMAHMDSIVAGLPGVLRIVVIEFYQLGGTTRQVGARLGISYVSVTRYLDQSYDLIAERLDRQGSAAA